MKSFLRHPILWIAAWIMVLRWAAEDNLNEALDILGASRL